jgi:cellobiose epimerase
MQANSSLQQLSLFMERELLENILPFWLKHTIDTRNGGFYGAVHNDLTIDDSVERSLVLCARMLWTFSAVYRAYPEPEFLAAARHAYHELSEHFFDRQHGGVFWRLNHHHEPVSDRKQTYGQAFAIYALSEYHLAAGEPEPFIQAGQLFDLLEKHAADPVNGGYIEGCARDWSPLADLRLSEKEPNCPKSMNTLLHVLEAYTNLIRASGSETVRERQAALVNIFLNHVIDPDTHLNRLFFSLDWQPMGDRFSFGHDIECSWLLVEAAEVIGDPQLIEKTSKVSLAMAEAVRKLALLADGSIVQEGGPEGATDLSKHWWAHAEGVVGFINAMQLSQSSNPELAGQYLSTALGLWAYIETNFIDRNHGEWFKVLDPAGVPLPGQPKSGPWEDPYHHSRACLEVTRRIKNF